MNPHSDDVLRILVPNTGYFEIQPGHSIIYNYGITLDSLRTCVLPEEVQIQEAEKIAFAETRKFIDTHPGKFTDYQYVGMTIEKSEIKNLMELKWIWAEFGHYWFVAVN